MPVAIKKKNGASIKKKAADWGVKAAFKKTYNSSYFKPFNGKAQGSVPRECLPSPLFYYKQIFPAITKSNGWINVCCCFHKDNNPSLSLNLESGGFFCFSCGVKGGDVIAFHRKYFEQGFQEAVAQLRKIRQEELE